MLVIRRSIASGRSKVLMTTVVCRGGTMSKLSLPRSTHASSTQQAEEPCATTPRSRAFHEPNAVLPAAELAVEPLAFGGEEIVRRAELGRHRGPVLHRNQQMREPAQVKPLMLADDELLERHAEFPTLAHRDHRLRPQAMIEAQHRQVTESPAQLRERNPKLPVLPCGELAGVAAATRPSLFSEHRAGGDVVAA